MADRYQIVIEVDERGAVTGMSRTGDALQQLDRNAAQAGGSFGRHMDSMSVAVGNLAARLVETGVRAMIDFARSAVQNYEEAQAATARLDSALAGIGSSYQELGKQLEAHFATIQRTTRYGDEAQAEALSDLIGITQDYQGSLVGLDAAIDLAAGRKMELSAAAELVGKAIAGNIGTLGRYGIVLSDAEKEMLKHASATERAAFFADEFHQRFGTAAARDLETIGGKVAQLSNYWGDFQEALAGAMAEAVDTDVFDQLIDLLLDFTARAPEIVAPVADLFADLVAILPDVIDYVVNFIRALRDAVPIAIELGKLFAVLWAVEKIQAFYAVLSALPAALAAATAGAASLTAAMGPLAVAIMGAVVAGEALAAYFDTWNKLAGYKKQLEDTTNRQRAFYDAIQITYGSISRATQLFGMSVDELYAYYQTIEETGTSNSKWNELITLTNALLEENASATVNAGDKAEGLSTKNTELGKVSKELAKDFNALAEMIDTTLIAAYRNAWQQMETGGGLFEPGGSEDFERRAREYSTAAAEAAKDAIETVGVTFIPDADEEALRLAALAQEVRTEWESFGDEMGDAFAGGITDALLGIFSGEDLTDVWGDWVGTATGLFASEFQDAIQAGISSGDWSGFSLGRDAEGNFQVGTGWVAGAGMVGGALGQYGAQQGNQTVGVLGGALSGAASGMAFGPWGAVVGAVIGGVMGYLGSSGAEEQSTAFNIGPGGVSGLRTAGHQYYGEQQREMFSQTAYAAYQSQLTETLDMLRLFGRPGMAGMLGAMPTWSTGGMTTGGADSFLRMLESDILPDIFNDWAEATVGQGLDFEGVSFAARQTLFSQLGQLPGADRQQALETYITAVVHSGELLEMADWDEFTRLAELDTMGRFGEQASQLFLDLAVMADGVELLTLPDVASQALEAEAAIESAMQTWMGLLQQVDAQEQAMHRSFASLREQIDLGEMSGTEQVSYYERRINELMGQLEGASYDEVGQITGDIQSYARSLMSLLGDDLYATMPDGRTWADWLRGILGDAEGAATDVYEATRDQIHDALDQAATELERWRELLGIGGDVLEHWTTTTTEDDSIGSGGGGGRGGAGEGWQDEGGEKPWEEESEWEWQEGGKALVAAAVSMDNLAAAIASQSPPQVVIQIDGSISPLVQLIQAVIDGQGTAWTPKAGRIG